jgi:hypothetical protein
MSFMAEMANPSSLTNQMYRFNQAQQGARFARTIEDQDEDEELDRALTRCAEGPSDPLFDALTFTSSNSQKAFIMKTYRTTGRIPTRSQIVASETLPLYPTEGTASANLFNTIRRLFTSCFSAS